MKTLLDFKGSLLHRSVDFSGVKVSDLIGSYEPLRVYLGSAGAPIEIAPERDALWFYLLNHAKAEVALKVHPAQPLGEYLPIVEKYYEVIPPKALRAFYYLLLICAREARHATYSLENKKKLTKNFPGVWEYEYTMTGYSPTQATEHLKKYPPELPLILFVEGLVEIFNVGSFQSGFGGVKWAQIAKVLRDFVVGETTLEVLLDNVWTLSHNNGPIFNKGMLYSQHSAVLTRILDVQRSGQIPQYVKNVPSPYVDPTLSEIALKIVGLFPELGGYVDWYKVEALGGIHSYVKEKAAQLAKHGPSEYVSKAEKDAAEKAKKAKEAAAAALAQQAKEKAEFAANHYEISSGVFVKKIGREAIA